MNTTNKYSRSKIYTIRCRTDTDLIYIGSTTDLLSKRFSSHKGSCNNENNKGYNLNVYKIMRDNGGIENFYIELYENFICNDRNELNKREGEVIRLIGTMNKCGILTTEERKEDIKEQKKQYYQENKEQRKQYYQDHKEELNEQNKKYQEEHKEEIKEQKKQYYQENKETIHCNICDCYILKSGINIHNKSIKHTKNLLKTERTE